MLRGVNTRIVVVASALAAVAGAALITQRALASIGVVDGGPTFNETYDPRVLKALAAFKKLPAGARGPATTQLYAWATSVLDTPAFKARYAKTRAGRKPELREHTGTVDDELKAKIAKESADMEEGFKSMEAAGM